MDIKKRLTLLSIYGDYSMFTILDILAINLNSDEPENYEWALNSLKEFGKMRKKQEDSGYLSTHYAEVLEYLKTTKLEP